MENRTAKKAKKVVLSVVFSRTALILLLVVVQLLLMLGLATYLTDYVVYVYGAMNILGAVIVVYIINQRGNPAFNMTWVLLILISPVFGCLFYLYVKSQLGTRYIGKRLGRLKLDTWQYMEQKQEIIDDLRLSKPANSHIQKYKGSLFCMWGREVFCFDKTAGKSREFYIYGILYCGRGIYVGYDPGRPEAQSTRGRRGTLYV